MPSWEQNASENMKKPVTGSVKGINDKRLKKYTI